jgi:mono/diheme cytochrome c family protein
MARLLAIAACVLLALAGWAARRAAPPASVRASAVPGGDDTPLGRGRAVYEQYGCALCHGADGKGGFANPNAETDGRVPAVIYVAEGYTQAELRRKVLDGVASVGKADAKGARPPFRMPGWRGQMTTRELDDLVSYLLSLEPGSSDAKWK